MRAALEGNLVAATSIAGRLNVVPRVAGTSIVGRWNVEPVAGPSCLRLSHCISMLRKHCAADSGLLRGRNGRWNIYSQIRMVVTPTILRSFD